MKLDIGCGQKKREGFTGIDILDLPGVDIVHDLTIFPYPLEDSCAEEIVMDNSLEHFSDPISILEELYRISKPNARITIIVPYFRSFYNAIDLTHKSNFSVYAFSHFDPTHPFYERYSYSKIKFVVEKREFEKNRKSKNPLRLFIQAFANRNPEKYEEKLSHLYPLEDLTFTLRAHKEEN